MDVCPDGCEHVLIGFAPKIRWPCHTGHMCVGINVQGQFECPREASGRVDEDSLPSLAGLVARAGVEGA